MNITIFCQAPISTTERGEGGVWSFGCQYNRRIGAVLSDGFPYITETDGVTRYTNFKLIYQIIIFSLIYYGISSFKMILIHNICWNNICRKSAQINHCAPIVYRFNGFTIIKTYSDTCLIIKIFINTPIINFTIWCNCSQ